MTGLSIKVNISVKNGVMQICLKFKIRLKFVFYQTLWMSVLVIKIVFIFFCLVFLSRTFTNHRTGGKGGGFFLAPLWHSTRFPNCSVFSVRSYWRGLRMNEDVASGSRNRTPFFIIKTSIRVDKRARFLDLLLNDNFQPLVTKQSFIKIYVTELLVPPQAFTCWQI